MGKVLFGSFVVDVRGKIGGTVYSRARGGATARNKVTPVNRRTAAQSIVRSTFGNNSSAWRALSAAERDTWIQGAPNFPYKDVFGNARTLSGQQLFVALNSNLYKAGYQSANNCPTPQGASIKIDGNGLYVSVALTPNAVITVEAIDVIGAPNVVLYVRATAPLSAGVYNPAGRFKALSTSTTNASIAGLQASTDITQMYEQTFGVFPTTGDKVFFELTPINTDTGESGAPIIVSSIAGAAAMAIAEVTEEPANISGKKNVKKPAGSEAAE